jgi:anti-sigma regulatory factor (Ser/Thr protein kinase)
VNEWRSSVPSNAAQLPVLTQFLQEFWSAAALPPEQAVVFELALEEIFMNVVMHGSACGAVPRVEVSLLLADGGVMLTVEDNGPEFDPLTLPQPDLEANLADRPIGGLGVVLVRQLMDAVSYHRVGASNRLSMSKRIQTPEALTARAVGVLAEKHKK